jgi:hypothetical protein
MCTAEQIGHGFGLVMIIKNLIVTLTHRRAGRYAVKPCGAQEKASAGLAWGEVLGSVRA